MTLREAIKHGQRKVDQNVFQVDPEALIALKLLIDAGKWRLQMEHDYGSWCGPPLPGETEE